jgi:predicted DsbA family dithiol-disulfide isomerase
MSLKLRLVALSIIVIVFGVSCTKGNTKPSYKYKAASGDGVAVKVGDISITEAELMKGLETDLYEIETKKFDLKFNKVNSIVVEKLMAKDPNKKGLTTDEYMDKYVVSKIKITANDINNFIKEKNIPATQVNPQIKERIKQYLMVEKKKEALDNWLGEKTSKTPIEIFFTKPRRPSFDVKVGNSPIIGAQDAKVEVVEFSDFQCPFCSKASVILKQLKQKYGKKIKIAFKQYPLPFHAQAKDAAVAALCANEQKTEYFWKLHDAMFADQSKLSVADLKMSAKKVGVDSAQFDKCLDSKKYLAQVEADIKQGQDIGVKSTPTFFVNGQLVQGAQPLEVFSEIIDAELK